MKILLTVDFYEPSVGGTQKVVKMIAEGLAKKGHDVSVATTFLKERRKSLLNGVEIIEFDIKGNSISGMTGQLEEYKDLLINSDFDIIFNYAAQQWTSDLMFECIDKIRAKKVIVPCGFSALHSWYARRYFAKIPYWLSFYDQIIFTSDTYQDYDFLKKNALSNLAVIPNGALKSEFLQKNTIKIREKLAIPRSQKLITLIGTHTNQKGHSQAIKIFKRIKNQNTTLLIIGNDMGNGCFDSCQSSAHSYNSSTDSHQKNKQIKVVSLNRKETIKALFESDLFMFPSEIECAPLVLYEAMAAGTAFMATDVGNVQEIAKISNAGWIMPTRRIKNYGYAKISESIALLEKILENSTTLKKKGVNGRRIWLKEYTFESIIDKYEVALKSVLIESKNQSTIKTLAKKFRRNRSVDVVIPTYNTADYLTYAVDSVMNQSYPINQLIIVDDGSTDQTRNLIKNLKKKYPKIKYVYQRNRGLSSARNTGIKHTQSEFIGLLDADDMWKRNKIGLQLDTFQKSPYKNLGLVYCEYEDIDEQGNRINKHGGFRLNKKVKGKVLSYLLEHNYATGSGSAVLVKRECFEKTGLFDESLRACEDWDMWLRIAENNFEFDYVNKKLVSLRRRTSSMQSNIRHMLLNSVLFFNKYINKGYKIPKYHSEYLRNNIFNLMFQGPKNLMFLYSLRMHMNQKLADVVWPNKVESIKAISWVFYTKLHQFWAKVKKLK